MERRQRARLAEMVDYARATSPYYRELFRGLPERVEDVTLLPVTDKQKLMARFDDWVTDRAVTLEKVRKFIEDPKLIGEKFLGKYLVATTSGTSGTPGIFVLDDQHTKAGLYAAKQAFREWLSFGDFLKVIVCGARMAALHGSPDYAHWHGFFELQQDLYKLEQIHDRRMKTGRIEDELPELRY
jgi:phenylacetate-coenzyme A ligase PaaK-like adenylate-forming protein